MVKMPRKVKRYSRWWKHTEHTVERVKKRRASEPSGGRGDSGRLLPVTEVSQGRSLLERSLLRGQSSLQV